MFSSSFFYHRDFVLRNCNLESRLQFLKKNIGVSQLICLKKPLCRHLHLKITKAQKLISQCEILKPWRVFYIFPLVRKWTSFVPKHFRGAKKSPPNPTPLHCSLPCSVLKKSKDSEALGDSHSRLQFILRLVFSVPVPLSAFDSCTSFHFYFLNAFTFRPQQCLHPARSTAPLLLFLLLVHFNAF